MNVIKRVVTAALVGMAVVAMAMVIAQQRVAVDVNRALCAFRLDLETRVESGRQFLAENPNGIPGISDETIQTNLDNQQRTLDSLSDLNCEEA